MEHAIPERLESEAPQIVIMGIVEGVVHDICEGGGTGRLVKVFVGEAPVAVMWVKGTSHRHSVSASSVDMTSSTQQSLSHFFCRTLLCQKHCSIIEVHG